jgi:hypothetical protein
MMIRFLVGLLITISLTACYKAESEYYREHTNLLQANLPAEAEKILKEGISKHPDSGFLKNILLQFYIDTDLDEAERYFKIGSFSFDESTSYYNKLASEYFKKKNFEKSYQYYMESGSAYKVKAVDNGITDQSRKCTSMSVSVESYRNAAASGSNLQNHAYVENALKEIADDLTLKECVSPYSKKQYEEVKSWLKS